MNSKDELLEIAEARYPVEVAIGAYSKARANFLNATGLSEEEANQNEIAENDALWKLIRTRGQKLIHVQCKLEALAHLLEAGAEWSDHRDRLLLESIRADLARVPL